MTQVVATRNLFVNTEETLIGDCIDTTINLPQNLFSCNENQLMRITLGSFTMKQNWYNVNEGNNKFYIVAKGVPAGGVTPIISGLCTIEPGNYQSYSDEQYGLIQAVVKAVRTTVEAAPFNVPASTVKSGTYDYATGTLDLYVDFTGSATLTDPILVSFTLPDYSLSYNNLISQIIGSDYSAAFQDNWQIMGGCRHSKNIKSAPPGVTDTGLYEYNQLVPMFTTGPVGVSPGVGFFGKWRASLSSQENIYIRTDLNGTNFQTAGFDANSSLFPYVVGSQILAKIPIPNENTDYVSERDVGGNQQNVLARYLYEKPYKLIQFMDNGENLFSMIIPQKHVSQLRLRLTDAYGRRLPLLASQVECSGSPFTATIRCDVLQ